MDKSELGTKQQCPKCGTRFYDLNREPIVCVNCEVEFVPELVLKPRRTAARPIPAAAKSSAVKADKDDAEVEEVEDVKDVKDVKDVEDEDIDDNSVSLDDDDVKLSDADVVIDTPKRDSDDE